MRHQQDPVERQKTKEWLELLKKAKAGEIQLLFGDESTVTLHPILRKCWMKRGKQRCIPATGQQKVYHLFAAYDYVTDQVFCWDATAKNNTTEKIENHAPKLGST